MSVSMGTEPVGISRETGTQQIDIISIIVSLPCPLTFPQSITSQKPWFIVIYNLSQGCGDMHIPWLLAQDLNRTPSLDIYPVEILVMDDGNLLGLHWIPPNMVPTRHKRGY